MTDTITEARERVLAWIQRIQEASADKRAADGQVDSQSLDRAADLELIYEQYPWVEEMPEPKRKRLGRRIDPRSREQFAKWVKQTFGWGSKVRLSNLHTAHEVAPILFAAANVMPSGEWVLRPFAKLRDQGYGDHQAEVWQAAIRLAEREPPTAGHVRRAVNEFLERHKPPIKNTAIDPRTQEEIRAARRQRLIDEFDAILAEENRAAKDTLSELINHYNAHQRHLKSVSA
jgi:hypothetical protein